MTDMLHLAINFKSIQAEIKKMQVGYVIQVILLLFFYIHDAAKTALVRCKY